MTITCSRNRRLCFLPHCFFAFALPLTAHAQTVTVSGSGSDASIKYDFSTQTALLGTVNSPSNGVGDATGGSLATSAEFVYVFALPTLTSGTLTSANLAFFLSAKNNPAFTVDLSGIRFAGTSTVLLSDNFQGAAYGTGTGTLGTPIQSSILTSTSAAGTIKTSGSGTTSLVTFLSQAYNPNGTVKGGDAYVFFNLHRGTQATSDGSTIVYNLSTADSAVAAPTGTGTDGATSEKPMLSITAAPEPGGVVSLLVGAAALSVMAAARRRQPRIDNLSLTQA